MYKKYVWFVCINNQKVLIENVPVTVCFVYKRFYHGGWVLFDLIIIW